MAFPTAASTGIPYEHFYQAPKDYAAITDGWEYEDGGMDFNRRTSTPPREWRIEFRGGLSWADIAQFDTFWDSVGVDVTFDFTDKFSVTHSSVRVKDYSRSHEKHMWWMQSVAFTLVKYP